MFSEISMQKLQIALMLCVCETQRQVKHSDTKCSVNLTFQIIMCLCESFLKSDKIQLANCKYIDFNVKQLE